MSIESRDRLHVKLTNSDGEEILQEGKYEAVRSSGAVIEYVLKDVDKNYITNMTYYNIALHYQTDSITRRK